MSDFFEDSFVDSLSIADISMPSPFLENSSLTEDASSFVLTPDSKIGDLSTSSATCSGSSVIDTPENALAKLKIRDANSYNEVQNFRRLSQEADRSRMRCNRVQLIINLMEEQFTSETELPTDLSDRCLKKLREFQLFNYLKSNPEEMEALDVDVPDEIEFSVEESNLLQSVMKNLVSAKCSQLKTENELISNVVSDQKNRVPLPGSIFTNDEATVLDRVLEMSSLVEQYSAKINSTINLHNELHELLATKFAEKHKAEMENFANEAKLLGLQIQELNQMIEDAFVNQSEDMTKAVSVLYNELQVSLHEAEYMLQEKKALKEKYDQLPKHEFDKILNEYSLLRENYKHKAWALKQIKEKQ